MKKELNKKNKFKISKPSNFFLKLFGIPSVTLGILLIPLLMTEDQTEEALTLGETLISYIAVVLMWFIISSVIALIVNELKKRPKIVKEIKYIKEEENIPVAENQLKERTILKLVDKNKLLYTCESKVDAYEYKKMVKYFPHIYKAYVILAAITNLLVAAITTIFLQNLTTTLSIYVILQILAMIYCKIRLEHIAEKDFNESYKKGKIESEFCIDFYDDYLIRQGKNVARKVTYSRIEKCIETNTNFYLKDKIENIIIIIQKNECELELINFIRDKFKNIENHLGDSTKVKNIKKSHHPKFIKRGMLALFIITIASIWGALCCMGLMDTVNPQHGLNFTKNMWVFWCFLPIPITSIVLGFKYKKAGFKCTKNIVGGFIVGFFLLIYGFFFLIPGFSQDYEQIDKYRNIIDAKLPENGELEIHEWDTYFDEDNYVIVNAYYDKENVDDLVESIKNSNNWILGKELKSNLKIFIPFTLYQEENNYYSIYNKTTDQYNKIPEKEGNYEIYAMRYDTKNIQLTIHHFNYSYK